MVRGLLGLGQEKGLLPRLASSLSIIAWMGWGSRDWGFEPISLVGSGRSLIFIHLPFY